jgi:hypothetical protein
LSQSIEESFSFAEKFHGTNRFITVALTVWLGQVTDASNL